MSTKYAITMVFGSVEFETRPVFDGVGFGIESRKITRDDRGEVVQVGEWVPPACWVVAIDAASPP